MIGEIKCNGAGEMPGHEGDGSYDEDFIKFQEDNPELEGEELDLAYALYEGRQ